MKIIFVAHDGAILDRWSIILKDYLSKDDLCFLIRKREENIMQDIYEQNPDLLITEDLEGFEMTTFADGIAYNLLHCRQIHLLLSVAKEKEKYLALPLSLTMDFYCNSNEEQKYYLTLNEDIPCIHVFSTPIDQKCTLQNKSEVTLLIDSIIAQIKKNSDT